MKSRKPLSIREAWQTRPVDLPGDRQQRVLRAVLDNLGAAGVCAPLLVLVEKPPVNQ